MKIRLFLFIIILVLPMAGSADFAQNNYCRTYANLSGTIDFGQIDANDNCDITVETAIDKKQIDNKDYKNFYNDEITLVDRLDNSEQNAQQMIEQVFLLCQTSQKFWQSYTKTGEFNPLTLYDHEFGRKGLDCGPVGCARHKKVIRIIGRDGIYTDPGFLEGFCQPVKDTDKIQLQCTRNPQAFPSAAYRRGFDPDPV